MAFKMVVVLSRLVIFRTALFLEYGQTDVRTLNGALAWGAIVAGSIFILAGGWVRKHIEDISLKCQHQPHRGRTLPKEAAARPGIEMAERTEKYSAHLHRIAPQVSRASLPNRQGWRVAE